MAYVVEKDYLSLIRQEQLDEILTTTTTTPTSEILEDVLEQSEEEVKQFLRHRFDVAVDMRDFQISATGAGVTAALNDRIYQSQTQKFYICTAAATSESLVDTNFFEEKDDRNQKLKQVTIDVLLYHLHSRINPRMVPDHRRIRYDGDGDIKKSMNAIRWLMMAQKGEIDLQNMTVRLDSEGEEVDSGKSVIHIQPSSAAFKK
jgi:hypothetical protein